MRLDRVFIDGFRNLRDLNVEFDETRLTTVVIGQNGYCRSIHGVFALAAFFAFPDTKVVELLRKKLGVTSFHSALALFRRPWFAKGPTRFGKEFSYDVWGAKGPAGRCARQLRDSAFYPLTLEDRPIDDYRDKGTAEQQLAAFLPNLDSLREFAAAYDDDRDLFSALEAV